MAAFSSSKKKNSSSSSRQPNYLYPLSTHHTNHFGQVIPSNDDDLFDFELEESDVVWGLNLKDDQPVSASKPRGRIVSIPPAIMGNSSKKKNKPVSVSLPVNVPDWSRVQRFIGGDDGVEEEDQEEGLPPHEYLARRRRDSFSVREGMGRTLKGMELCRARNEILKKLVGFED